MDKYFQDRYEALPRPKSWMPGPPAPWSQTDLNERNLTISLLKNYFESQDQKISSVGELVSSDLPESAIENLGDNDISTRPAGVLVPFVLSETLNDDKITSLMVMTRTMTVSTHKGQVSFPGGMKEQSDQDIQQTALRETNEEVGINSHHFHVLATRPAVNTRTRSSLITPVVAVCSKGSLSELKPNKDEVDAIHIIEISELVKPGSYFSEIWDFGESSPTIHMYFAHDTNGLPVFIWGATAHILTDILHCLRS